MNIGTHQVFGGVAVAISITSAGPYLYGMAKGRVRPHVFSWFLWGLQAAITFAAQISHGAGPGAWATGVAAFGQLFIAALALRMGEKNIRRTDWIAFALSLATLPLWYVTHDALYAVILLCFNEVFAFYPTFRKSWHRPQDEDLIIYAVGAAMFALSFFAMDDLSFITGLYPATIVVMNSAFIGMVVWRRYKKPLP